MNNQNLGKDISLVHCSDTLLKISTYRFDEFGFRVEEEDGPEPVSNKLLSTPFIEDPQQRCMNIAIL
jgi:hypothetical protein